MALRKALTDGQLALALSTLADALGAGLSLTAYLGEERSTMPAAMRHSLAASLRRGLSLSDALQHADVLAEAELGLMRAGEASGRVEPTLRLIAEAIEERRKMRWQLTLGLAYPCFLIASASVILPLPKLVSEGFASYLATALWGPLAVALLAVTLLLVAPRVDPRSRVRAWTAGVGQLMPIVGTGLRMLAHGTVARVLGHNIAAGLPLPQAVGSALLSSGHPGLEKASSVVLGALAHGRTLHEALAASNHFDRSFIDVVANAERSGALDTALLRLAASLSEDGSRRLKLAIAVASVLVLVGTMAMIVRSIIGFYVGYFAM